MSIEQALLILLGLVVGLILNQFLPKYIGKKGENLATKEDIAEITDKIEGVRIDYAEKLESTRANLSSQINTHGFRYEKEFAVLSDLTELLVDVRDSSISLRPVFDRVDPDKTEKEIKQERLQRCFDARRALYLIREKKRPFYPDEIYAQIKLIEDVAHTESIEYQYGNPNDLKRMEDYWEKSEKNKAQIEEKSEQAIKSIRERVTKWDSLPKSL
jgi:hypothetical protein